MDLSIVIPVYRSARILPALVGQIKEALTDQVSAYELILVNDCSPDESWEVICGLCSDHPFLKGINLRKNVGQHNAIMAGLNHAKGDVVVMMDDDLQHSPHDILRLCAQVKAGYDVCYVKFKDKKHATWKRMGSAFNNWVATFLLQKPRDLYLSSFKAIAGGVRDELVKYTGPYVYVDGLILMVTSSIVTIELEHFERYEGTGNYSFFRSLALWAKMATNFSVMPLRAAATLGLLFSALGLLSAALLVMERLMGNDWPPGWASVIVAVLVIGGFQLLAIGLIGEYLGRTYITVNRTPQYTVRESRNLSDQ